MTVGQRAVRNTQQPFLPERFSLSPKQGIYEQLKLKQSGEFSLRTLGDEHHFLRLHGHPMGQPPRQWCPSLSPASDLALDQARTVCICACTQSRIAAITGSGPGMSVPARVLLGNLPDCPAPDEPARQPASQPRRARPTCPRGVAMAAGVSGRGVIEVLGA